MFRILFILFITATVSSCGQYGKLYLPVKSGAPAEQKSNVLQHKSDDDVRITPII